MSTTVGFEQLHIRCIIGILPHERVEPQDLYIDLSVRADLSQCKLTDEMPGTLDYRDLARATEQTAIEGKFQTIEHLAHAITESIQEVAHLPVERMRVKIRKPAAIPEAKAAFIEWEVQCPLPL